jgi:transposase
MATTNPTLSQWLTQAGIATERLTVPQTALVQAAFCYRQQVGTDYYANHLLSHFLLHSGSGLAVAQIARLVGISRPTASRQQRHSAKATIQQARHRLDGRPYGKLLPRYAGPIVEFLCRHPDATRADLIDFINATFGVRVSRVALYKFLKKYGLDQVGTTAPSTVPATVLATLQAATPPPPTPPAVLAAATPAVAPAPPCCLDARTSRARS